MDTGGLAQMTYNNHHGLGGGFGFPNSGYGSRGKGENIKKLNVPLPNAEVSSAPRTSRSHLLAGLRTAPKSPAFPTSAPPTQLEQPMPPQQHQAYLSPLPKNYPQAPPKTATGMGFGNHNPHANQFRQQIYSPEQILAPPTIQIGDADDAQMDPRLYDELVRTNQYLAQQQMRLQQQLINVTAAAQQFQNMNMGPNQHESYTNNPMSVYQQQMQQGMQPVVNPIPGSAGLFTVYNPMTGQTTIAYDQNSQNSGPDNNQGQTPTVNNFRTRSSPPPQSPSPPNRSHNWRNASPPKFSTSPPRDETTPLPPPSANAFRPGAHRKNNLSLINGSTPLPEAPKTAGPKSMFPRTPMTGTFGPGQAQEGEHPVRQPRGPPSMEDLVAKPTTKFEGSKNFASRQRRGAVKNLVRAGIERRGVRGNGSVHSSASGSPTSEAPMSVASDDLSVRSGSASLEGRRDYFGSKPRSPNPGVIGEERKQSRERTPIGDFTASSISSDDDYVEVKPRRGHMY